MALSNSPRPPHNGRDVFGARNVALVTTTFDSSYPTGGEAFDPNQFGIEGKPAMVFASARPCTEGSFDVRYNRATEKLQVFWVDTTVDGAPLVEVTAATNLSSLVVDLFIISGDGQ